MPKIRISDKGIETLAGSGFEVIVPVQSQRGYGYTVANINAAGDYSVANGGHYTISANPAMTASLPDPANYTGVEFGFRSTTAIAHEFTCSAVPDQAFVYGDGGPPAPGSHVALQGQVGNSIIFKSDGLRYFIMASSGTLTITSTV